MHWPFSLNFFTLAKQDFVRCFVENLENVSDESISFKLGLTSRRKYSREPKSIQKSRDILKYLFKIDKFRKSEGNWSQMKKKLQMRRRF